jgi:5-methylcytosine-specific restriction endonuclease McrA
VKECTQKWSKDNGDRRKARREELSEIGPAPERRTHIGEREKARRAGEKRYRTGRLCAKGHDAPRRTQDGRCVMCRKMYEDKKRTREARNREKKRYYAKYPERKSAESRTTRARRKNCEGRHTGKQIKELLEKQNYKCGICLACLHEKGYHADHVMPISKGGSNWIENIEMLCPKCNLAKRDKLPLEFAKEAIGMFL